MGAGSRTWTAIGSSSTAELEGAGFLDLLVAGTIVLIEWGERFRDALPADRLEIEISRPDETPTQRRLEAVASGPAASRALAEWGPGWWVESGGNWTWNCWKR